ncbi:hypothetical protein C9994_00920 [Marivirga lumbricoides]|uniref:Uncharacterized protein n=1 Tax=Marivirga lumbricoides TaxID=1046115 RepID=A0A2T4DVJ6_9BACT|nr:hypothetical protein C9994_00920 [Marivirga lumbricoides]
MAMGSFGKRRPKKGTLPTGSAHEKQGAGRVKAGEKQVDQKVTKEKK